MSTAATATARGAEEARPAARPPSGTSRRRLSPGRVLAWTVMIILLIITLFPFFWMLRTALSSNSALYAEAVSLMPADANLGGFQRVFGLQETEQAIAEGGSGASIDFWRYLVNTVLVATGITVCQVFFSAMAAYAFSRLQWKGRDVVFGLFLLSLMVPVIFTLLPNFLLVRELGLIDTLLGIMLPSMFMTPFAIFFLRQFFMNVPTEVEEAALIDGAGRVRVFFTLIIPMTAGPIATVSILTYITAWNDYLWPLMVSYTDASRVLTVALGNFTEQSPQTGPDWAGLMAATLVAALPMLLLFMLFARRIVSSIGFSGIK
ncbi:carbohydrate ABC transporter permease [Nesterenkonia sp. PF2B19]|uniref:carbohydrate ABC transporter permease n=1 Tax=unclassified Nesterenkonia TaxID=2629769 RepID=UPI0008730318|nr:carbohydrate ABC transporter permease [Nesterenkonia sp. PF2B19]OSM44160.1 sugar ABC transporter permease [Nesterenkonia sp. PF2B19]